MPDNASHAAFIRAATADSATAESGAFIRRRILLYGNAALRTPCCAGGEGCPAAQQSQASGCPVGGQEAPHHGARTAPASPPDLGQGRQASSIPVADPSQLPANQATAEHPDGRTWLYPSEQMFYDAMKRKGWTPSAQDMQSVVQIHNAVNERVWMHILHWERLHCSSCPNPKLLRFRGRPKDFSPRARLLNMVGYSLPFDRHDWVVDRCGTEVRYVIDFYSGSLRAGGGGRGGMFLDVRPALDSWGSAVDRVRMFFITALSST